MFLDPQREQNIKRVLFCWRIRHIYKILLGIGNYLDFV